MAISVKEGVESSRMEMDGGSDSITESLWVKLPSQGVIVGGGLAIILQIRNLRGKNLKCGEKSGRCPKGTGVESQGTLILLASTGPMCPKVKKERLGFLTC